MTTNTDQVRWSVLAAIGVPLLCGIVGGIIWFATTLSGVASDARNLASSVDEVKKTLAGQASSSATDTKAIKDQLSTQANALIHLDDEFHFGGTRMDAQDRKLAEITAQLSALKDQVERQQPTQRRP